MSTFKKHPWIWLGIAVFAFIALGPSISTVNQLGPNTVGIY